MSDHPKSFRFTAEEKAILDRLAEKYGYKGAVMEGLRLLDGRGEPTNDELIDMLKQRLKEQGDT